MSVKIVRKDEAEVKTILGGPITIYCTPETVGSKQLVFVLGSFSPGEGLDPHIHPESEEVYYVITGKGTVYAGKENKKITIEAGMALYIPAGTQHYVRNTGTEKLVIGFALSPGTEESEV
jgi:mannose-6-phosphate isomerase-like protein (cupin superfamily)